MRWFLLPVLLSATCVDRSPYCNQNDCSVRPGYAREFCQKTCGNCTDFCENSKFVACTEERKSECDAMLRDYCPKLCGACRAPKRPRTKIPSTTTLTTILPVTVPTVPANTTFNAEVTERAKTLAPFVMPPMYRPTVQPIVEQNQVSQIGREENSVMSVSEGFLPELPQPVPLQPQVPIWAPHTTGYYPPRPATLRRSPPRTPLYPQQYGTNYNNMQQFYGPDPRLQSLVSLLGCRDRDPSTCSKITDETCLSRPGFYLKLCPVRCRNCDGLQCFDSIKVDCEAVRRAGGCRLAAAAEYCPRSCQLCPPPPGLLADSLSICRDELDTCAHLAEGGLCDSGDSDLLRIYCARSCGFCKQPQFYTHSPFYRKKSKKA